MGKNNIEKWSPGYELLRTFTKIWHNLFYYRRIHVLGKENIPENEQFILATSHQNALMDAMAVLLKIKKQPVFLARSDIFRKKMIARILYFIKILPIYRIRDGYAELKKNDEIFLKTMDVLENKSVLAILPEGSHAPLRKVRPLKKGIARIAFQSAEKQNFSKDIKIVPVGLEYSNYTKWQQELIIKFGKPISLSKYYNLYRENPSKATLELVRELREEIKKQMIHIEDDEHYDLYNDLRMLFRQPITQAQHLNPRDQEQQLKAQQNFISLLEKYLNNHEEKAREMQKNLNAYKQILDRHNIPNRFIDQPLLNIPGFLWRALAFLLLSPIFLYGFINNILPYKISSILANKVRDITFHSSFKFVISLLLFPVLHLLETGIFYLFVHQPWYTLAYFISLPLTGLFTFRYYVLFSDFWFRRKYAKLTRRKHPDMERLRDLHNYFIHLSGQVLSGEK
ncbi:MAG TPA: hypothetical protein ENK25_10065 [Bacteroidetes bacterium]|nr:hypothetical protein [Bacteroidota bacterium]